LPNWCGSREQASLTKCGKNIVVACWANDRQTRAAGSGEAKRQECTQYLGAGASVIFRRTASTSDKAAVRLKATSPKLANSGRAIGTEPDDATIAAAIAAARASLLMAKRIDDPVPWDQFDANDFQHR
jgi:hypothetical protein